MSRAALAIIGAGFGLVACVVEEPASASAEAGRAIYDSQCSQCHGSDGTGGGPIAATLSAPPPDLTALNGRGGFPWNHFLSQVDGYDRSPGEGDPMPAFGEDFDGPMIPFNTGGRRLTPTPKPLVDLALYVESLQKP